MSQAFAFQLDLQIQKTNVQASKIDSTILKTYEMIVSTFFISDKNSKERFFEKSLLLANIKPELVFKMFFLIINNANIDYQAWNLQ